jgi:hypothetical protein
MKYRSPWLYFNAGKVPLYHLLRGQQVGEEEVGQKDPILEPLGLVDDTSMKAV